MKIFKILITTIVSILLVTIGIDATDNYDNLSDSIFGRIFLGDKNKCEEGMMYVLSPSGGFCLDKYEASPGLDCFYQNPLSQSETKINIDNPKCKPASKDNKMPWTYVLQSQAKELCAKSGKRLATNEEWTQGAMGTMDKNSNWKSTDCQVNNNWSSQPGLTGSAKDCISSFGIYDTIGNVWEWVDETIVNGKYENNIDLPKEGYVMSVDSKGIPVESQKNKENKSYNNDYMWIKPTGVRAMARGGYWNNRDKAGKYAFYLVPLPSFSGGGVGFRCVGDLK